MNDITLFCSECGEEVYEGAVPTDEWLQVIHQIGTEEEPEAHVSWMLLSVSTADELTR